MEDQCVSIITNLYNSKKEIDNIEKYFKDRTSNNSDLIHDTIKKLNLNNCQLTNCIKKSKDIINERDCIMNKQSDR
tara:strand:+ start:289 stop:516 length:228 start_codon:yes stop_codon:yes gene_type:complete